MLNIKPNKEEFLELATAYNVIPVYSELSGDMYTAISIFKKMKNTRYQFLLESAVSGEFMGRYSFMGYSEKSVICKNGNVSLRDGDKILDEFSTADPIDYIRKFYQKYISYKNEKLPPFVNGLIGYMGYNVIQYFEKIKLQENDPLNTNDFELILAENVIILDNLTHKLYFVCSPFIKENDDLHNVYNHAIAEIEDMISRLYQNEEKSEPFKVEKENGKIVYKSNFSRENYESAVEKIKDYIYKGDIFQLVLSQRLKVSVSGDPFNLYRSLRIINPSPYMFYLKFDDIVAIGSSPEIHVQCNDGKINVRPIAGTRQRGTNPEEDKLLEKDLMNDEKELAEHLMLVDLGRNDIGRVAVGGTVKVDDFKKVEYYSHVMHIVSNVTGRLSSEYDVFDLIKATFPAGTVSGAPKVRAMEIISELEPERRGIYSGMIGYFSFDQNFDSCIAIRTIVVKDNVAYLQAGAGIVADSVPEKEYYETIHKMRALTKALDFTGEIK